MKVIPLSHLNSCRQIDSFLLSMVAPWVSLRVAASGLTDTSKAISLNLTASLVFLYASHPPARQHMLPFSTLYMFRLQMLCQQYKDLIYPARWFAACIVPPCFWTLTIYWVTVKGYWEQESWWRSSSWMVQYDVSLHTCSATAVLACVPQKPVIDMVHHIRGCLFNMPAAQNFE